MDAIHAYNASLAYGLPFRAPTYAQYHPWYELEGRGRMFAACSDVLTTLLAPVVLYWALSLLFMAIDALRLPAFERHRLHEPEEIARRNKVTLGEVVKAVCIQHVIQTAVGYVALEAEHAPMTAREHDDALARYAMHLTRAAVAVLGHRHATRLLMRAGATLTLLSYWWLVPVFQLFWAFFLLDSWQYGMHRLMHQNRWLYRHIHARHHRLYVPYACGALYNHPVEGFLLDMLGSVFAHAGAGLSTRGAFFLFSFSSLKTVDDHCGYALPWDPFQFLFPNSADYHDIHHQQFGIKANFSQPYFIHWDTILGTRMTREQAAKRRKTHTDLRDNNVRDGLGSTRVLVNSDKKID